MFDFADEKILVVINGNDIKFGRTTEGARLATIEGLKLDKRGVLLEFPDLNDKENWRQLALAIERFKEKIKGFVTEEEKAHYIITDLKKYGYIPRYKQKKGFRPQIIQWIKMTLWDNVLTVGILISLAVILYCRLMHKSLPDLFNEIKEILSTDTEEVITGTWK